VVCARPSPAGRFFLPESQDRDRWFFLCDSPPVGRPSRRHSSIRGGLTPPHRQHGDAPPRSDPETLACVAAHPHALLTILFSLNAARFQHRLKNASRTASLGIESQISRPVFFFSKTLAEGNVSGSVCDFSPKSPAISSLYMPTINQLVRKGRRRIRAKIQGAGAAGQSIPSWRLCSGDDAHAEEAQLRHPQGRKGAPHETVYEVISYIPDEGHNLQEHSIVLVRGGRVKICRVSVIILCAAPSTRPASRNAAAAAPNTASSAPRKSRKA